MVSSIIAVYAEVLLRCLDRSFTESICLRVVGSRKAEYYANLLVEFIAELGGELGTTVRGDEFWESI